MRATTAILGTFLAALDTTILVDTVTQVGDSWRMAVTCNGYLGQTTLHAIPTRLITGPNATVYTITAHLHDEWFEVSAIQADGITPVAEPPLGLWTLPKLDYMHGTPKAVNAEMVAEVESRMPMVWLMEIMQEKVSQSNRDPEIVPLMRLHTLDSADYRNWLTEDHYEEVVLPMRNYMKRILDCMVNGGTFGIPINDPTFFNHARFALNLQQAKKTDLNSHQQNLFSEQVSGVECRVEIPILRECC